MKSFYNNEKNSLLNGCMLFVKIIQLKIERNDKILLFYLPFNCFTLFLALGTITFYDI